ncbi:NLRC3 protein [Pseudoscourfieldia marina]
MNVQRATPKSLFANERTFTRWSGLAMTIGTLAMALYAFAMSENFAMWPLTAMALTLLFLASVVMSYAIWTWFRRTRAMLTGTGANVLSGDEIAVPIGVGVLVCACIVGALATAVISLIQTERAIKSGGGNTHP